MEGTVAESIGAVEGCSGGGHRSRYDCGESMLVVGRHEVWRRDSADHDYESDKRGRHNQLDHGGWSGSYGWTYRLSRNTVVDAVCALWLW